MTPKIRTWTRDQSGHAKVRRIGFALAPEFGGTIHSYCGDTMDAALLDLLEWHRRPTMEDMHKAYVGKSRTRQSDHLLIVQPYSPHLFRQGELPGPTILMKVLRQQLSTAEAKKEWKAVEKNAKREDAQSEKKWMDIMTLPCRNCSDNDDQSTWKPMTAFHSQYRKMADVWKHVLAKGQDLQCLRCHRKKFWLKSPLKKGKVDKETFFREFPMMRCAQCEKTIHHSGFAQEMQNRFIDMVADDPESICKECERGHCHEKREDVEFYRCNYCDREDGVPSKWPGSAFSEARLLDWQLHSTPLKCAACVVEASRQGDDSHPLQPCFRCQRPIKMEGPPQGCSPVVIRQFEEGERDAKRWVCYDCQFPKCDLCSTRPTFAGPAHTCYTADGKYICEKCRFPPCDVCKVRETYVCVARVRKRSHVLLFCVFQVRE